ncbi:PhzF family phenazine biosynthesis protein [Leifsonia sp. NPDC058230]|uniref:PhzF family phenazine biosynthesis protein n=1 Tax=Leifsonia sp. NPDC058230 TaxID=3346391 RepID=UPI0036DB9E04
MAETVEVVVVRVFADESGGHGNELGIIRSSALTEGREQTIATGLGFSETVFVDAVGANDADGRLASIRIFTPARELPFAGHPSVGTAWWLDREGTPVAALREKAGDVVVSVEGDTTWITARAEWAPEFEWIPLATPAEVDASDPAAFTDGHHYAFAWIDESAGRIRSRMFAPEMGIAEDEATGAAAVRVTALLGRDLHIVQGSGSELVTALAGEGRIRVGGRTVFDRTLTVAL